LLKGWGYELNPFARERLRIVRRPQKIATELRPALSINSVNDMKQKNVKGGVRDQEPGLWRVYRASTTAENASCPKCHQANYYFRAEARRATAHKRQ
jgi:hypothetical protein